MWKEASTKHLCTNLLLLVTDCLGIWNSIFSCKKLFLSVKLSLQKFICHFTNFVQKKTSKTLTIFIIYNYYLLCHFYHIFFSFVFFGREDCIFQNWCQFLTHQFFDIIFHHKKIEFEKKMMIDYFFFIITFSRNLKDT